ncbi:hypothetical protein KM043_016313 [Ampulex compressa]|nr:hypothetical protein KM043_016313 [Ampulex compressa]
MGLSGPPIFSRTRKALWAERPTEKGARFGPTRTQEVWVQLGPWNEELSKGLKLNTCKEGRLVVTSGTGVTCRYGILERLWPRLTEGGCDKSVTAARVNGVATQEGAAGCSESKGGGGKNAKGSRNRRIGVAQWRDSGKKEREDGDRVNAVERVIHWSSVSRLISLSSFESTPRSCDSFRRDVAEIGVTRSTIGPGGTSFDVSYRACSSSTLIPWRHNGPPRDKSSSTSRLRGESSFTAHLAVVHAAEKWRENSAATACRACVENCFDLEPTASTFPT